MQFVIGNMQVLRGSFGLNIMVFFLSPFVKMPIYAVLAMFTFASVNHLISASAISNSTTLSQLVPSKILFCYFTPKFSGFTNRFVVMFEVLFEVLNLIVAHAYLFIKY
jgi:hypothetical protein